MLDTKSFAYIVHDSLKMCYVYNHTCNRNESLINKIKIKNKCKCGYQGIHLASTVANEESLLETIDIEYIILLKGMFVFTAFKQKK